MGVYEDKLNPMNMVTLYLDRLNRIHQKNQLKCPMANLYTFYVQAVG